MFVDSLIVSTFYSKLKQTILELNIKVKGDLSGPPFDISCLDSNLQIAVHDFGLLTYRIFVDQLENNFYKGLVQV